VGPPRASDLALRLERQGDVPIGTQLAWALRARIVRGVLEPGEQLPTLRDLADATHLNVNTVRAVYARLERDGLLETRHGTGTFVAEEAAADRRIAEVAATAAHAAAEASLDPRDVAAALYSEGAGDVIASAAAEEKARRRELRDEIGVLEGTLVSLQVAFPDVVVEPPAPKRRQSILSVSELEGVRAELFARLVTMQKQLRAPDRVAPKATRAAAEPAATPSPARRRPRLAGS
jgi:GntR family transcriptional regulator